MSKEKKTTQVEEEIQEESTQEQVEDSQEETKQEEAKEEAKQEEAVQSQLLRLQADFENYKKRTQKEKSDIYQMALEGFVKKLLPVLDNLERAEKSGDDKGESSTYRDGVQMVFKELINVMDQEGVKEIESEGKAFDPNFHHGVAVGMEEDVEDQIILEVFQKGYTLKGKVVRPAMVKINQK